MYKHQTHFVKKFEMDFKGIEYRLQDLKIRDCFVFLKPEGDEAFLGLVTRSPMDQSFLESALKDEGGYLNIDIGRIDYEKGGTTASNPMLRRTEGCKTQGSHSSSQMFGRLVTSQDSSQEKEDYEIGNTKGRWPSNVILKHTDECECIGTKKVKAGKSNRGVTHGFGKGTTYLAKKESGKHYADENGEEETPEWDCEKGCPVFLIDQQSGYINSSYSKTWNKEITDDPSRVTGIVRGRNKANAGYKDSGGASRFFKQVRSDAELEQYLNLFIRDE